MICLVGGSFDGSFVFNTRYDNNTKKKTRVVYFYINMNNSSCSNKDQQKDKRKE